MCGWIVTCRLDKDCFWLSKQTNEINGSKDSGIVDRSTHGEQYSCYTTLCS